jgi:hypothetical protein
MDEDDTQRDGDLGQVPGEEGIVVVHIELAGQAPFQEGLSRSIQVGFHLFGEIKLGVRLTPLWSSRKG